jgi:uncharacterized protein (UPF0333 family)
MPNKKQKAQAGLEYLMTYGWALVIIVVVAGVLFFVLSPPTQQITFRSSTRDILLRSSNAATDGSGAFTIELQNASGKNITLTAITPINLTVNPPYDNCAQPSCSISTTSGQIIKITGALAPGYSNSGDMSIQYTIDTYAKTATISASGQRPGTTSGGTCPDGIIDDGEVCDGTNFNGQTCADFGFGLGSLTCTNNCTEISTAACAPATCGDGIINGEEACDGTNFNGQTCADFGFSGGTLVCDEDCTQIILWNCTPQ